MSRVATPAEKIMAVAGTYAALLDELPEPINFNDSFVQAALIEAATKIAMGTDTRDMGLLALDPPGNGIGDPDTDHTDDVDELTACDDCGALPGELHDLTVEH